MPADVDIPDRIDGRPVRQDVILVAPGNYGGSYHFLFEDGTAVCPRIDADEAHERPVSAATSHGRDRCRFCDPEVEIEQDHYGSTVASALKDPDVTTFEEARERA